MADVKIDNNVLETIIQKAIYDGLSEEMKKDLLTKAIATSFKTPKDSYGRDSGKSDIQSAFDNAVRTHLYKYAVDKLEKDEGFTTQLEGLFKDIAKKLFEDKRSEIVGAFAAQIIKSINGDRY